ncbi:ATP-grasp domain-containing protein [Phytomonospora endophytica]|uniref:Biotin carboxylase n=1 Tax=Phytomonospora endophytica TaxID=714109 RepID=A0A841FKA6_9ACTN|nr:biotin carboxylase [Phytomonospora endophytica]MBB6033992.1 biotin carboxylase [Phytomonospora endophytica]GIG64487.1 hypothetical protein Pen01_07820 [Phytomonospora endophytica]
MTERPHVVVIHRWAARYAEYERYLDHRTHAVTYVTTEVGAVAVPPDAAEVVLVAATDDLPGVADRVKQLAEDHGPPAAIVALKEDDLLVAARLRAEWGCPGPSAQALLPFRDKLVMAQAVAAAGIASPAFATVSSPGEVAAFAGRHGRPVVLKPRIGSASEGVSLVDTADALSMLDFEDEPLLAQSFDARQIFHVDGLFDGVALGPWRASRYLNTCLGFRTGDVLGSVEEDDEALLDAIGAFATRVLSALSEGPTPFHLELFVDEDSGDCAFLEVGARVGGAEIPFLWREVHGYDLMEAAFRLSMGLDPLPWRDFRAGETAGWLLVPAPAARPCRITEATPMTGRVPGPYAEALLRPGEILPAADAYYEHVGGRFRFRGRGSGEVTAAIEATARDFRVSAEPR